MPIPSKETSTLRREIAKLKRQLAQSKTVYWSWDEDKIDPIEFIRRISPMICEPIGQARDCDGDMYMSEFRKIVDASYHLKNAFDSQ